MRAFISLKKGKPDLMSAKLKQINKSTIKSWQEFLNLFKNFSYPSVSLFILLTLGRWSTTSN